MSIVESDVKSNVGVGGDVKSDIGLIVDVKADVGVNYEEESEKMQKFIEKCLTELSLSRSDIPQRYKLSSAICLTDHVFIANVVDLQTKDYWNLVAKVGNGSQIMNELKCLKRMNEIDAKLVLKSDQMGKMTTLEEIIKNMGKEMTWEERMNAKDKNGAQRLVLVDSAEIGQGSVLLIETPFASGGEFKKMDKLDSQTLNLFADRLCNHLKILWIRYGLLHLDIKPSNIIIDYPDIPLLIDFGLSVFADEKIDYPEGWTTIYSSKNQRNLGKPCKWDDVEALCNTFYAMEIGIKLYESQFTNAPPDFDLIHKKSQIVKRIVSQLTWTAFSSL